MEMRVNLKSLQLLVLAAVFFYSCSSGEQYKEIVLPETPALQLESNFAVITQPLVRLLDDSEASAEAINTLYRGYVVEVNSRSPHQGEINGTVDYWYQVSYSTFRGWVFGSYLELYQSKQQAERVSESMK
jgi:hypothetical protein